MIRIGLLLLALGGCAGQPIPVTQPLPLPAKPMLPKVKILVCKENQMQCVTKDTVVIITTRDVMRKKYAESLEAVIQSTWVK